MTDKALVYEAALRGIASCATECGCCEMHVRVARSVLDQYSDNTKDGFCDGPVTAEQYPGLSESQIARLNRQCESCEDES